MAKWQSLAVILCAVPPEITPTWAVVKGGLNIAASSLGLRAMFSVFTSLAHSISLAPAMIALTPVCRSEECTSKPTTWVLKPVPPLWPVTACMVEGSPTITSAPLGSTGCIASIIGGAPVQPISSSKLSAIWSGRCTSA